MANSQYLRRRNGGDGRAPRNLKDLRRRNGGDGRAPLNLKELLITHRDDFGNLSAFSKDFFMKRRNNEISNTIAKDVLEEIKTKDSRKKKGICSLEQAGTALIGIYSTNQVQRDVIAAIHTRVDIGRMAALKDLLESKIELDSAGFMGKELTFLWRLYKGLKYCSDQHFHHKSDYFPVCSIVYLMDRLSLLSALCNKENQYLYCMKSVLVEWILSENLTSYQKYVAIPYGEVPLLSPGLKTINNFLVDVIKSYTSNDIKSQKKRECYLAVANKMVDVEFITWMFVIIAIMNLNKQVDDDTATEVLELDIENEEIRWVPDNIRYNLMSGFQKKSSLQERVVGLSQALLDHNNQLVIIELNQGSEKQIKIPSDAIFIDYTSWKDQEVVLEILFKDNGKEKKAGAEKRKRKRESEQSGEGSSSVKVIQSDNITTTASEFPQRENTTTTEFLLDFSKTITEFPLGGKGGKGKGKKKAITEFTPEGEGGKGKAISEFSSEGKGGKGKEGKKKV